MGAENEQDLIEVHGVGWMAIHDLHCFTSRRI